MQGVEHALEVAVAQDVPCIRIEVDGRDVVPATTQRIGDLLSRAQ